MEIHFDQSTCSGIDLGVGKKRSFQTILSCKKWMRLISYRAPMIGATT